MSFDFGYIALFLSSTLLYQSICAGIDGVCILFSIVCEEQCLYVYYYCYAIHFKEEGGNGHLIYIWFSFGTRWGLLLSIDIFKDWTLISSLFDYG